MLPTNSARVAASPKDANIECGTAIGRGSSGVSSVECYRLKAWYRSHPSSRLRKAEFVGCLLALSTVPSRALRFHGAPVRLLNLLSAEMPGSSVPPIWDSAHLTMFVEVCCECTRSRSNQIILRSTETDSTQGVIPIQFWTHPCARRRSIIKTNGFMSSVGIPVPSELIPSVQL